MAHYRRYYVNSEEDGSYRVISHGGVIGFLRWLQPLWFIICVSAFFLALFTLQFAAAGVLLLFVGLSAPNFAKHRHQVIDQAHREGRPAPPSVPDRLIKRLRSKPAPVGQTSLKRHNAGRTGGVPGGGAAPRRAKDIDSAPLPIPSAEELTKLSALRDQGLLTDEEFAIIKHRLISQGMAQTGEDPDPTTQE
jgi:hypothetical protein